MTCIAYIIRANKDEAPELAVYDPEAKSFHRFALTPGAMARLAAECTEQLYVQMGGVDFTKAHQEITLLWSKGLKPPSGET